jgi:hypothetical protein
MRAVLQQLYCGWYIGKCIIMSCCHDHRPHPTSHCAVHHTSLTSCVHMCEIHWSIVATVLSA